MNRTVLLVLLFVVLGAGAFFALRRQNAQQGSVTSWDMEFAVPNTDEIGKIFIADRTGDTARLERKDGYWLYNGRDRARPTGINNLLNTIGGIYDGNAARTEDVASQSLYSYVGRSYFARVTQSF